MNWQSLKVSADNTYFIFEGNHVFNKRFSEVLKFHAPGLAPVKDNSGAYHIDASGNELYPERYSRTFGYYCNRATVVHEGDWFHLTDKGQKAYRSFYAWAGNFQEDLCTVRDSDNNYFHIDLNGQRIYEQNFLYAGDYKDGIACVKTWNSFFSHIDSKGNFVYEKQFQDLGVFHKNHATAKDDRGWHHIDKWGNELYSQRYLYIEPFYNGFALATQFDNKKFIINEMGEKILEI